jgi:NhaP-type Na+/H+ or K+/H+ antiporter
MSTQLRGLRGKVLSRMWQTVSSWLGTISLSSNLPFYLAVLALSLVHPIVAQSNNDISNTTDTDSINIKDDYDVDFLVNDDNVPVEIVHCQGCIPPDAILYPWFVQLLGCITLFLLTRFNIPLPYAAIMFILGAIMGAVSSLTPTNNVLTRSINQWTNIDSGLLLLVFLPGLIFKDAVTIPIHLFLIAAVQIWILAFPMVLVGTALTALVGYYVLPYEWPWSAAATLGAILAATDPIAVASVLKTAGASPRLVIHISGESLLNDGSAFVFFAIFSQLFYLHEEIAATDSPDTITVGDGVLMFVRMSIGGTCVGAAFAAALLLILWELDRRLEREFDILQVIAGLTTAYLCYFVCDQLLGMSGVVAVVVCGVIVNYYGRGMINDEELMESYLILADYLLNTLLFTLGGTIWAAISFENKESYQIQGEDWGWLFILYLLVMLIRFVQVGLFYPVISRIGLKSEWREAVFLAYGGLRGAVGVALGLALVRHVFEKTQDDEIRRLAAILQFMGGGVTLLTLSINGTSAGPILKMLGLSQPAVSSERVKLLFEGMAMDFVYEQISQLYEEYRFQHVNFEVLKKLVPYVSKEPARGDNFVRETPALTSYATQRFNQRLAGGGDQYVHVVNLTRRASELPDGGREKDKEQLLVELRQIFFELLGEAYNLQLEMGELDMHEDNGFLYETLQASVNLARNEVEHNGSSIEDWKWTEKFRFSVTPILHTQDNVGGEGGAYSARSSRIFSGMQSLIASLKSENSTMMAARARSSARRLRLDVLKAIAFQQGHKMARLKLELFINRNEIHEDSSIRDTILSALEKVKEESLEQVQNAQDMLEQKFWEEDLEVILSRYCASIILRRLMKFTERKAEDGMLGKIEARKYLGEMEDRLGTIVDETIDQLVSGGFEGMIGNSYKGTAVSNRRSSDCNPVGDDFDEMQNDPNFKLWTRLLDKKTYGTYAATPLT